MSKPLTVRDDEENSKISKEKKVLNIYYYLFCIVYTSIFLKQGVESWQNVQVLSGYKILLLLFLPRRPGIKHHLPIHFSFSSFGQEKESRWPASGRATFAVERLSFHISRELYRTLKGIQFPTCPRDQITKLRGVQPQLAAGDGWEAKTLWWA